MCCRKCEAGTASAAFKATAPLSPRELAGTRDLELPGKTYTCKVKATEGLSSRHAIMVFMFYQGLDQRWIESEVDKVFDLNPELVKLTDLGAGATYYLPLVKSSKTGRVYWINLKDNDIVTLPEWRTKEFYSKTSQ